MRGPVPDPMGAQAKPASIRGSNTLLPITLDAMLAIRLLGRFEIVDGDSAPAVLNAPAVRALLAFLLTHHSAMHSRQRVAFALYPDAPEAQAQANLRKLVHRLRAAWPRVDTLIEIGSGALGWRATNGACFIDSREYEDALRAGNAARAVELYGGDLLPDEAGEWVVLERERLRAAYLSALDTLCAALESSDPSRALDYCTRLINAEPLREDAHRRMMLLHAVLGDAAGVQAAFQRCEHVLRDELGIAPSDLTRAAFETSLARAGAAPAHLREIRGAPVFATPFIGRIADLNAIAALFADPANRLITIHAPGGMGKTRVLHEALRRMSQDAAVVWVSFEEIREARQVLPHIAEVLGYAPGAGDDAGELLRVRLRDTPVTLGLDNMEPVLDAAPGLAALLKACPRLRIIATSREPLSISWERIYDLGALDGDSRALFEQAARRVKPDLAFDARDLALIDRICTLAGGMPLAIELAAAFARDLSPGDIYDEIARGPRFLTSPFRDTPARQRSVHDVLNWSWERLRDAERIAMCKLSVFAAGFSPDDAASLLGVSQESCARMLRRLTARMLLKRADARHSMHSLIQQFAREALRASGEEDAAREAHAHIIRKLGEDQGARFGAGDMAAKRVAGDALRLASSDIHTALDWLRERDTGAALTLAHAMFDFWMQSGRIAEARAVFGAILPMLTEASPARARGYNRLGVLAMFVGDYDTALSELERARREYLELGDASAATRPLGNMVIAARHTGDYDRTILLAHEVLTQLDAEQRDPEQINELISAAVANMQLAAAHSLSGQTEPALKRLDRAMALLKQSPDPYHFETEHSSVGYILLNHRDYPGARAAYLRCLEYSLTHDARAVFVACLHGLAGVAAETGQPERAARLFGAGHKIQTELGLPLPRVYPVYDRTLAAARAGLSAADFQRLWEAGQALSDAEAAALAAGTLLERRVL
jgi:predicted ATPase/DNA-binding SARP family transcriptional activator